MINPFLHPTCHIPRIPTDKGRSKAKKCLYMGIQPVSLRLTYHIPHTTYHIFPQTKIQGTSLSIGIQHVSLCLTSHIPRTTWHVVPTDKRGSRAAKACLSSSCVYGLGFLTSNPHLEPCCAAASNPPKYLQNNQARTSATTSGT